jgi:tripartite-type tricarboxylate transporter receptor subunit TctC
MKQITLLVLVIFFFIFPFIAPQNATAAPFYEGKVLRILVGHEVGGGYDRITRLLANHLVNYIPGKPTIIVENMPGAQSMIETNYLYNIAKPDGLTIATFDRGLPFAQLLKLDGVKFDLTKLAWIGSAASEAMIMALRADLPYKTVDDLRKAKEPIILGGVGAGASDTQFATLLKEFTGLNIKIINYPSSAICMLAIERKEVDGKAGSYNSLKPFIERGMVRPFIRSRQSEPALENIPVNEDLTTSKIGKTLMAMLASADRIGRPFAAPPKTPANIMPLLRNAFSKVVDDPKLKEEAKKMIMTVNYIAPDEALKVVNYVLSQPDNVVKEFRTYMQM